METIETLIAQLKAENAFSISANDPTLQFTVGRTALLFSSVLPERTVTSNVYRDDSIRFRTMIANDSTRYSPPQKKNGMLMGSVSVELGDSDTASEMSMQMYESFINTLDRGITQEALASLLRFFQSTVSEPMAILREKHRVDAIGNGYVVRKGANRFQETVRFLSPAGHRLTVPSGTAGAPAGWYNPAYSILNDLKAAKRFLEGKGYRISRIITSSDIMNDCFMINTEIKSWGLLTVQAPNGAQGVTLQTRPDQVSISNALAAIGVPDPIIYDAGYYTQANEDSANAAERQGYIKFMENRFVILCETGRDESIDLGADEPLIQFDTLGYTGIGKATGQLTPGVATKVENFTGKDARIEAMAWQTSFPVINEPEGYLVFTINPPAAS